MTPALPPPEPPEVALHAFVRAGAELALAPGEPASSAAALEMARLKVAVSTSHLGATLQLEAADTPRLLDAVAHIRPVPWLTVRAGQFKTPVSADFLVPAPRMRTPTRAWIVQAVPRRELGISARAAVADVATVELGVFDPVSALDVSGPGVRPVLAANVELPGHVAVHAAATTWIRPAETDLAAEHRPGWDHVVDGAVAWHPPHSELSVEGLLAHRVDGDGLDGGITALAAHTFPLGTLGIEVAGAWDTASFHRELAHRLTAAVNLHVDGWRLVARASWEASFSADLRSPTEAVGRLQLQAGF